MLKEKDRINYVFCPKRVISKLLCLIHTQIFFFHVLLFNFICCFTLNYCGILNSDSHKTLVITWKLKIWVLIMSLSALYVFKQSSQTDLRWSSYSSLYLADYLISGEYVWKVTSVLCWNGFWFFFSSCSVHATREKMAYSVECLRDYV